MFPMSSKGGGVCMAMPDVLKVPAAPPVPFVPAPFPNVAQCATAVKTARKVMVAGAPALNKQSEIPLTQGGEAGTLKGVISPMQLAKAVYRGGSTKVKVEGVAAVAAMMQTAHNGANANAPSGVQTVPSQAIVMIGS